MTEVIIEPISQAEVDAPEIAEEVSEPPLLAEAAPLTGVEAASPAAPKAAAKKKGRPPGAKNKPKPTVVKLPIDARGDSASPVNKVPRQATNENPVDFETHLVDFLLSRKAAERDRRRTAWSSLGQLAIGNRR